MTCVNKSVIFLLVIAVASAIPIDQSEVIRTDSEGHLNDRTSIVENVKSVVDALLDLNESAFDLVKQYVSRIVDVSKTDFTKDRTEIPDAVERTADIIPAETSNVAVVIVPEVEVIQAKSLLNDAPFARADDDVPAEAPVEAPAETPAEAPVEAEPAKDKPNDEEVKPNDEMAKPNDEEAKPVVNKKPQNDPAQANKIPNPLADAFSSYKKAIHSFASKIKAIPDAIFKKISSHLNLNYVSPKDVGDYSDTIIEQITQ